MSGGARVVTESLGGSPLARLAIAGEAPAAWYGRRPRTASEWEARLRDVASTASKTWLSDLAGAFDATGAANDRLERVARDGGVVVTTGQQPGYFGGPVYTWSKAISTLAFADALEESTGIPTAPVFWAATDDADFAEASSTWIALSGGERELRMPRRADDGLPMAEIPLGDVSSDFALLCDASRSAIDASILDLAKKAYHPKATVGSAYLTLLRAMLQPLGVAVIDASHPSLLAAERPLLVRALEKASAVAHALGERSAALQQAGHAPQVADVEGLSLVFRRAVHGGTLGDKARIPIVNGSAMHDVNDDTRLSPNVLLRPVVERAVLPTAAYIAGPGELNYFAQVSAVADSLGAERPLALPRWSCTIVEPQIEELMARLNVSREELARPHEVEKRLARAALSDDVLGELAAMRSGINRAAAALRRRVEESKLVDARVIEGAERQMSWRVDHVERRLIAASKRREQETMRDVATLRGALYPNGKRQERALNFLPMLARNGAPLLDEMRRAARAHANALVGISTPLRA